MKVSDLRIGDFVRLKRNIGIDYIILVVTPTESETYFLESYEKANKTRGFAGIAMNHNFKRDLFKESALIEVIPDEELSKYI